MFQVIVQYFEDRFASFFVDKPIELYKDLLQQVRKVVPVLGKLKDEEIKISYKDIQLDTFINIDPSEDCENLHLTEAFRNYTRTGSDVNIYRRVHLQVREVDSPFLLKKRTSRLPADTGRQSPNTKVNTGKISKCLLPTFSASGSAESTELVGKSDWKASKKQQIDTKLQALNDQKLAIETHIRELELDIIEPPRVGSYNTICGNCHIRGHRSEGNQRNGSCNATPCTSYYNCGQKKKHKEHFDEIKKRKKELKEINSDINDAITEQKNLDAFQSKSISAFSIAITPRLLKAFGDKYSPRTSAGKLELQKDIATLRLACDNKIPPVSENERELFTSLLQRQKYVMGTSELGENNTTATQSNTMHNAASAFSKSVTANNVNKLQFTVSPIRTNGRKKTKRKVLTISDTDDPSSESSSSSDSSLERKRKRRKRKNKKFRSKTQRSKSSGKKRRHRRSSSSESEHDDSKSRSVHVRKQQDIYERFGPPNDNQDSVKAAQSASHTPEPAPHQTLQATRPSENCSLEELAVIAVAVDKSRK